MEYLNEVLRLVAGLVGFPAFLAALIDVLKRVGILKDGTAPAFNLVAHLVVYVGVGVAVLLGKVVILPNLDLQLGNVANILLSLLALLSSIGIATKFHNFNVVVNSAFGFSYSEEEYKKAFPDG